MSRLFSHWKLNYQCATAGDISTIDYIKIHAEMFINTHAYKQDLDSEIIEIFNISLVFPLPIK